MKGFSVDMLGKKDPGVLYSQRARVKDNKVHLKSLVMINNFIIDSHAQSSLTNNMIGNGNLFNGIVPSSAS